MGHFRGLVAIHSLISNPFLCRWCLWWGNGGQLCRGHDSDSSSAPHWRRRAHVTNAAVHSDSKRRASYACHTAPGEQAHGPVTRGRGHAATGHPATATAAAGGVPSAAGGVLPDTPTGPSNQLCRTTTGPTYLHPTTAPSRHPGSPWVRPQTPTTPTTIWRG